MTSPVVPPWDIIPSVVIFCVVALSVVTTCFMAPPVVTPSDMTVVTPCDVTPPVVTP